MLAWIVGNIGTIIVAAVIASVIAIVVIRMAKNKKKGKFSCGCGCSSCPMSQNCHNKS